MQKNSFLAYKITDPAYYSHNPTRLFSTLMRTKSADLVTLRDKHNPKLKKLAKRMATRGGCLNQNFTLARRVGIRCVHFTSSQLQEAKRARRAGFFTIFSAHTFKELKDARRARIHLVTFSPIFASPGKGAPLGVRVLRKAVVKHKNIIALGGIVSVKSIHSVKRTKACGFASIRAFV